MRKRFEELCIEVTKNREELKEQRELIDFLLEHDRNDVVLDWKSEFYSVYTVIKYIYDKKIKAVSTKLPYEYNGYEVIENTKEKIVLKISFFSFVHSNKFYKITKKDGIIMDITDIYKEEPTTVANPDTPTETDFKYFTAEQVRKMSPTEVRENYSDIMKSMKKW